MKYSTRNINSINSGFSGEYKKPLFCPHCGVSTDAHFRENSIFALNEELYLLSIVYECTDCEKKFLVVWEYNNSNKNGNMPIFIYPSAFVNLQSESIEKFSPRFIEMYNQALQAETNNNLDLAAMGYRAALEILIKDYAIKELDIEEEVVIKKSLFEAIEEYLNSGNFPNLANVADVVRLLGNDYTHYHRKYPQHDFSVLKKYMDIFVKLIEVRYDSAHTPFSDNN